MNNSKKNLFFFLFILVCMVVDLKAVPSGFISFSGIVTAISSLIHDFCGIIAGLCGFIGLARFAWVAVTGGHDAVGTLVGAVVGYAAATIATTLI